MLTRLLLASPKTPRGDTANSVVNALPTYSDTAQLVVVVPGQTGTYAASPNLTANATDADGDIIYVFDINGVRPVEWPTALNVPNGGTLFVDEDGSAVYDDLQDASTHPPAGQTERVLTYIYRLWDQNGIGPIRTATLDIEALVATATVPPAPDAPTVGSETSTTLLVTAPTITDDGGSAVTNITMRFRQAGNPVQPDYQPGWTSGEARTITVSNLPANSAGRSLLIAARADNDVGQGAAYSAETAGNLTSSADTTPPVVTAQSIATSGSNGATGTFSVDEVSTSRIGYMLQSATAPDDADFLAGTDGDGNAFIGGTRTQPITITGAQSFAHSGLQPSTAYKAYVSPIDGSGNATPPVLLGNFTTDAVATTEITVLQRWQNIWDGRHGSGKGPNAGSKTPADQWANATAGVSLSGDGKTVTVSGSFVEMRHVDASAVKLVWTGEDGLIEDCIGEVVHSPSVAGWFFLNARQTVRRVEFDCTNNPGTKPCISLNHNRNKGGPSDLCVIEGSYFYGATTDPVKMPFNSKARVSRCAMDGVNLAFAGSHYDGGDNRTTADGFVLEDTVVFLYRLPGTPGYQASTGIVNNWRLKYGDNNHTPNDHDYRFCIFVAADDGPSGNEMLNICHLASQNMRMSDVLVDQRIKANILESSNRGFVDWEVYSFDADAAEASGVIGAITPVPYPNVSQEPAARPSTMVAPTVTDGSGSITVDLVRPDNQRSHITGYAVRHRTGGGAWTTLDPFMSGNTISGSGSIEVQAKARNAIGLANSWSPSGTGTA